MKTTNNRVSGLIAKGILTIFITAGMLFTACQERTTTEENDAAEQAEEQNEAKFDRADEKDAKFVEEAVLSNMREIQMGQLAQKQGQTQDVKNLGKMMETDHSKALEELKAIATQKNISFATSLSEDMQKDYDNLAEKTGLDFDKDFADKMVDYHEKNIRKFEDVANDNNEKRDLDIKNWANKTLTTLRMHLDQSMATKEKVDQMEDKSTARKNDKTNDNLK